MKGQKTDQLLRPSSYSVLFAIFLLHHAVVTHSSAYAPMEDAINRLRSFGLAKKEASNHATLPRASILVPIFEKDSAPHFLLTKRQETLRSHSGEVCFPGGRRDPDDSDDVDTALREAMEEVGIPPDRVSVLCRTRSLESVNGLCVTPIVGWVGGGGPTAGPPLAVPADLDLSEDEVEAAFAVPLSYFIDERNCVSRRDMEWKGGSFTMRHYYFQDEACDQSFKIWGLTAAVAYEVAKIALDSGTPAQEVATPEEI